MPELPELEVLRERTSAEIQGKKIEYLQVLKPYVLRELFGGDLAGQIVKNVARRGKYLIIDTDSLCIMIHLMLHGSLKYHSHVFKPKRSTAALISFVDGSALEFSERGSKKRMLICITQTDEKLLRIESLGVEPLGEEFTTEKLAGLLKGNSMQLKSFLCRQDKIAGIGNAYSDEILWEAGLSPFKLTTNLSAQETEKLHRAIIDVLSWAIQNAKHSKRLDKRDFLQIHGKRGHSCPKCGDTVRIVSFAQRDTFYCPTCQTGGNKLKDRRLSKFYR